jgi:hypothetical protein
MKEHIHVEFNGVNADFVQQFANQCLDVTCALKTADSNLYNFLSSSLATICWWLVVKKAAFPGTWV